MSEKDRYSAELIAIGNKLRLVRKERGLTMRDVSDRCDMDENNYGRFEKGQTNPTITSLLRICSVLEIDLVDLFKS